ncbi:hypothetical protein [Methylotuvimicrobium buryatense]|uniref:hypothetical protein n=1 Tax=Methylotuvimicrobium buryatense TaxID=95641 RepID=UPI0003815140|nr:hypothetical protein [Methylotuvimicrobium buryatense]
MTKIIHASMQATLPTVSLPPLTMVPPTEAQSYLIAARGLFEGAEALAISTSPKLLSCAFLSAQTLECALKAFLASSGATEKRLRSPSIRHNLEALWAEAVAGGLAIPAQPPQWCTLLNSAHDKPYYFRYPMRLNGMSLPAPRQMVDELRSLLALIGGAVR